MEYYDLRGSNVPSPDLTSSVPVLLASSVIGQIASYRYRNKGVTTRSLVIYRFTWAGGPYE